jgi:hypothetical protein
MDFNFFLTYSSEAQYVQYTVGLIDTKTRVKKSYMLRHFEEEVHMYKLLEKTHCDRCTFN